MRSVIYLALGLSFYAAPLAFAGEKDPKLEQAMDRFDEGSKAYAAKDYTKALKAFQESFALSGETALLYNIATCQQELKMYSEAVKSFEAFLAAQPKHPKRKEVEKTLKSLKELLPKTELTIAAKLPEQKFSAELFIAGQRFSCEATPCQLPGVPSGDATVKVKGAMELEKTFAIPEGDSTITLEKKKNWPAYTALGLLGVSAITAPLGFLTGCDNICKGVAFGAGLPMLGFGIGAMIYPSQRADINSPNEPPKPSILDKFKKK